MPPQAGSNLRCARRYGGEGQGPRWSVALLVFALGALFCSCGGNQPTASVPVTPPASIGVPDQQFDQLFTQNGPGWTGGDGAYSVRLPDGRTVWLFSDSYIGTVDPATRRRASLNFQARNCLVVQDQNNQMTTLHGGTEQAPSSFFVPPTPDHWFWVGAGTVTQPTPGVSKLVVFLSEMERDSSASDPMWAFRYVSNSVATLSLPDFAIETIQPLNMPTLVVWGAYLMKEDPWVYIYGVEDLGIGKYAHVARASAADLANPAAWNFWNGSGWVGDVQASARLLDDSISNQYSVDKVEGTYLMVAMDTSQIFTVWRDIVTYVASAPTGPWTNRTVVYSTPETGRGHLFVYNPTSHAEFTQNGQFLISYCINSATVDDLINADNYRPRFIRAPLSRVLP